MAGWDHARYCDAVADEIGRFSAAISGVEPDAPVPSCPGWSVTDLIRHLGRVHCWAGTLVRELSPRNMRSRELDLDYPDDPAGYPEWFAAGAEWLVGTLRAADPEAVMWTWGVEKHVPFWSRRMLHETAMHRCDAEIAGAREPVIEAAVAVDGIDELLEVLPYAHIFVPNVANLHGTGETIAVNATDTPDRWLITLAPDGFTWRHEDRDVRGSASVSAAVSDLNLFLYGRHKLDDPRLTVSGDEALLIHWIENSAL